MTDSDKTKTLHDLIKDIRFAMFTTRGPDGSLRSRPMTTQNDPDQDPECLWFFAARSGEPVADLLRHPAVNTAFADPSSDAYVSVSGSAAVVEDDERKKQLWSKFAEAWFPGGPTDPDLALVRVAIEKAEYWNVRESKVTQLLKMARANLTGRPPTDMGEHEKV